MTDVRKVGWLLLLAFLSLPVAAEVVVEREIVGLMKDNCYLVYDTATKEAAIVDPGGPIDRLLSIADEQGLAVKYIFITHAHPDHTAGIPGVRERFPGVKLCISKEEYEDAKVYRQWEQTLDPKEVAEIKKDAAAVELMNFEPQKLGPADILVKDGQSFSLGETPVRAYLTPGHSRGSVCYLVGPILFSGDVLFNHQVGRSDLKGGGGWEQLVASIRRLYSTLPDDTHVYPGHGLPTDIGSEKRENPRVSEQALKPPS